MAVLERDVQERYAGNGQIRLVFIAPAIPGFARRVWRAALGARERLLGNLMVTFATGFHESTLRGLMRHHTPGLPGAVAMTTFKGSMLCHPIELAGKHISTAGPLGRLIVQRQLSLQSLILLSVFEEFEPGLSSGYCFLCLKRSEVALNPIRWIALPVAGLVAMPAAYATQYLSVELACRASSINDFK